MTDYDNADDNTNDEFKTQNRNETIFIRRAGTGLFWAIGSLFAPFLFLFIPNLHNFLSGIHVDISPIIYVGFLFTVLLVVWAASIVHCVWEMIKHHALLSGIGLFLLIIQPVIWAILTPLILFSSYSSLFPTFPVVY